MNPSTRIVPRFALLATLLLTGCSFAGPSDAEIEDARSPEAEGVIVNRSSADVVALGFDLDVAAVISLASEFDLSDRSAVVGRGEAGPLAVGGYRPGRDFVVYLYRVSGTRATYAAALSVDGGDFERDDRVVTVRRF